MSKEKRTIPRICEHCGTPFLAYSSSVRRGKGRFCGYSCGNTGKVARPVEERFWEKVHKTDTCWLWIGNIVGGYGHIRRGDRAAKAHRVSWEIHNGPVPSGEGSHGTCVLHRCDVRNCVNPDHLFLGTNTDNMRDMAAKGRAGFRPRGESSTLSKLTAAQVVQIRERYAGGGATYKELAARFGVSKHAIYHVIKRHTWAWL